MSDEDKKTQDAETQEASKNEEKKTEEKTLTQAEVDRIVQERLARATERNKMEVEKAVAEAQRLAKLNSDEREKELAKKKDEELKSKEKELTLRENKLVAMSSLAEVGIPTKFVDFVLSEDKDEMSERIEILTGEWRNAVSEQVKKELKGEPPKDINPANSKKAETKADKEYPNLF